MKNEVTTFESENIVQEPDFNYPGEYTYADYLQFKMDDMVEVIRGRLFRMSPAPRTDHQKIVVSISSVIYQFLKNRNCKVFSAPVDVILPVQNKKEPQQPLWYSPISAWSAILITSKMQVYSDHLIGLWKYCHPTPAKKICSSNMKSIRRPV
ncbi:MAG: Uma2 family endonuclease [Saprospiraceae bacterium]|nr:Uma2 family endonuclease [Saprospiraceae bacterium]